MKVSERLKYTLLCMGVYLLLCLIEVFVLKPLVDFINDSFLTYFVVYNIFFILINPILTYCIYERLPLNYGKRNKSAKNDVVK